MEAGTALTLTYSSRVPIHINTANSNILFQQRFTSSSPLPSSSSSSFTAYSYRGPKPKRDFLADWVSQNDDVVRTLPIYVGSASLFAVLLNRALSGIAPVADAGSSQSRADLLTLGLAVTNILTGLVWLSIRPKSIAVVNPQGVECKALCNALPGVALNELLWVWESLSDATCCRSLVIVYESSCVLQIGLAAESSLVDGEAVNVDVNKLMKGSVYQGVMKSGAQSYLANLSLYPGKSELPFLPSNTQFQNMSKHKLLYRKSVTWGGVVWMYNGASESGNLAASPVVLGLGLLKMISLGRNSRVMVSWFGRRQFAIILQPLEAKGIAIIGGDTIRGFTASDQAWITYIGEKLDSTLAKYVKHPPPTSQN